MRVGIFYSSIGNPQKFPNKTMLMDNFAEGVIKNGDTPVIYREKKIDEMNLDAGFVLGFTLEQNFRRFLIDSLHYRGIPGVFVDSNILHYGRKEHEWHRYSLNSVYPSEGIYFFDGMDRTKWDRFSSWHNISLKPWRQSGKHILILCQRPKGWNFFGKSQDDWLDKTVKRIRKVSDRPIVVRMHPGDATRFDQMKNIRARHGKTVSFSDKENITEELTNCWCAVGYNSTPTTVSAIEGIPVYVEDPENSWAKDIAFTDLSMIETPPLPDREEWKHKIANIHWSNEEIRSGLLWKSIKKYISSKN